MAERYVHRYSLRPEARPLHWSNLNESQRNAFLRILDALHDACSDVDEEASYLERTQRQTPPTLPEILDPFRSSRLIFLSGQRGTGKSTILLSLFDVFRAGEEDPPPGSKTKEKLPDFVSRLRNRLVWLEPLDMEPLPRPTNLLAAILARIDEAVSRFTLGSDPRGQHSALLDLSSGERALHDLRKLAADVAIAWDGNVEDRAASLDPDAYAEEVRRVEEARLKVNHRFAMALEALSKALSKTLIVNKPVFVLPIDDYDLNPLRALDLLHLIRMVSTPRLFILVLGDIRIAETVFNLKKSGEFATVIQHANDWEYLSLSPPEIGSMARALAGHAIRKLVPPGQRLLLGNMEVHEALKYSPKSVLVVDNSTTKSSATLKSLLEKLPADVETAPERGQQQLIAGKPVENFKDFLLFNLLRSKEEDQKAGQDPKVKKEPKEKKDSKAELVDAYKKAFPYSGVALLKAAPRFVADLWFSLEEIVDSEPLLYRQNSWRERLEKLINLIGQEAHRAVEEDRLMSIRYRERFVDALGIGDEGWLQAMRFVEARSVSIPGRLVPFREHGCVLHADYLRSWAFWDLTERSAIDIDERTKAMFVLLHDLLALERGGGIVGSHALSPNSLNLGLAYAAWDVGLPEEVRIQWITPEWTSFWEFDQFSHVWKALLHNSPLWNNLVDESERRALMAYTWITAITHLLAGDKNEIKDIPLLPENREELDPASYRWDQLAAATNALIAEATPTVRGDRIRSWLTRLPVLLAPESGFMVTSQMRILPRIIPMFLTEAWEDFLTKRLMSYIRRLRADRLAPFIDRDEIEDMRSSKHILNTILEGQLVPDETELEEAQARYLNLTGGRIKPRRSNEPRSSR